MPLRRTPSAPSHLSSAPKGGVAKDASHHPSAPRPPSAPRRPPNPNPAPKGGVAKSEFHTNRVKNSIQRQRDRNGGVLSEQDKAHAIERLRRARYADQHGTYLAGDAAIAAEQARVDDARNVARAREIAFMCGPSQATTARQEWTQHDALQPDVRAQSAREPTPKANTPQSRTSSGSPPGKDTPRRDLLALLMAASPMAASPMAAVQADLAAEVIDFGFGFDTPHGSDNTPSI